MQLLVLGHQTPRKSGAVAPLGTGLGFTDQLLPFQCSKRADDALYHAKAAGRDRLLLAD